MASDETAEPDPKASVPRGAEAHPPAGEGPADRPSAASATVLDGTGSHPEMVGPYRIIEPLGEGGMGIVYRALSPRPVQREVAVKLIKLGLDTRAVIARFDAERQALAIMDHPHIARVLDAGSMPDGRPYFAMELVRGEPITRFCDRRRLPIRRRLELFADLCDAVQHAHSKGVIHRDLKATNVLVSEQDGRAVPKIIDFGIAKAISTRLTEQTLVTLHGRFVGTPGYVSPEQAEGTLDVDTRTDIYSLGVLLYELLAGRLPFSEGELKRMASNEILRIIREVEPPRPSQFYRSHSEQSDTAAEARRSRAEDLAGTLRRELEWIPLKAMRKDRTERYITAAALAEDVRNYLAGRPLIAGPDSVTYRVRKVLRRHRVPAAAAMAVAAALVLGVIGTSWQAVRAGRAEYRATARAADLEIARDQAEQRRAEAERLRQVAQSEQERAEYRLARHKATSNFLYEIFNGLDPDTLRGHDPEVLLVVLDEAEQRIERDLPDPVARGGFYHLLGDLYRKFGDLDRAGPLLERGVALSRQALEAADDSQISDNDFELVRAVIEGLHRQARWHEVRNDLPGAIARGEEARETAARHLPADHRVWVFCDFNLATHLWAAGKRAEAMALLEAARARADGLAEQLSPVQRALILNLHGVALKAARRFEAADSAYETAERLYEEGEGIGTLTFADLLFNRASLAWTQGKFEEALEHLDRTAAVRDELLGDRPLLSRRTEWDLRSRIAARQDRYGDAIAALQRAIEISKAVRPDDTAWLEAAEARLSGYEALPSAPEEE